MWCELRKELSCNLALVSRVAANVGSAWLR